jgi:WD40 repeat protein
MQRITKRLLSIALLFVAVSLLSSCAMGSAYKKVDKIPDGMGVVYIYRPSSIMGPAAAEVDANRVGITSLSKGGYYPYFSKPGEVEFSSQVRIKSTVTLYIEAGQTYYIKGTLADGILTKYLELTAVPPDVGEKEIVDCKLQEGKKPEKEEKTNKTDTYALIPDEILLLKKSGVSDEKILEMQKKGERLPAPKINPFDWNEDGKKDILTGSKSGQVYAYINKGTNQEPIFDNALEIFNVKVEDGESAPYVIDWNSDGKKDILAGSAPGEVSVFINRGDNLHPIFEKEKKLNDGGLDVGDYSSPAVVDWNGDGKKDFVVGNKNGKVFVFINFINNKSPIFQKDGIETSIKVSGYARPFIVDWNNDGKFDVVSGSSDGKVYIFVNEGDGKNPKFSKLQTVQVNNKELKLPNSTSVIALDWDDDGKTDLLVSNKEKNQHGIYLLLNTGTKEKPEFGKPKRIKGNFRDDTVL